jgi:hypothetical protein
VLKLRVLPLQKSHYEITTTNEDNKEEARTSRTNVDRTGVTSNEWEKYKERDRDRKK